MCFKAFSFLFIIVIIPWCHGKPFDEEYEYLRDDDDDGLYRLPANGELFEGDMVMDDRLRRAVWGEQSKKSALLQVETKGLLWPNGVIYYEVDIEFPWKNKLMLRDAIDEFHNRTCIKFIQRKTEFDYVYFTAGKDECSSSIGRSGGRQDIFLGEHCRVLGTFLHESMHALGFIHEHSRSDRDAYLEVKYENIKKSEKSNFQKYKMGTIDDLGSRFDFNSILLYRNDAFTKNGQDTLQALADPKLLFGQRIQFSVGDVKEINRLYGCIEQLKDPNYKGLFKEVHYKARKKDSRKMIEEKRRKRLMDFIKELQRRVYAKRGIF